MSEGGEPKFIMVCIGNSYKNNICLFLNPIVWLLLFCLYMLVIPIKYVYANGILGVLANMKFVHATI
jgi:hypothetical protein